MMRLPPFRICAPVSVADAVKLMADHGPEAMLVAGGTDLYPNMKRRQFEPTVLVGLRGIRDLAGVRGRGDGRARHRRGDHAHRGRRSTPRSRARYPALATAAGAGLHAAAPQHGHARRQRLRGHALQLLQPVLPVAEGRRLLHEEGRRDLPGGAGQPALLGGVLLRHRARAVEPGRERALAGPARRAHDPDRRRSTRTTASST